MRAWSRLSLRARLVVSVLLLLTLALGVTGLTVSALLRDYLASRVDEEMARTASVLRPAVLRGGVLAAPFNRRGPRQQLPSRYVVRVLGPDGGTVSELADQERTGIPPDVSDVTATVAAQRSGTPYTARAADGTPWRILVSPLGSGRTFVLATPIEDVTGTTDRLRRSVLAVDLVVLVLGGVVALAAVRGSLRPLTRIEDTAEAISRGDLSHRVPEEGGAGTEIGRLSRSLNGMLAQIEEAFAARAGSEDRMRRFMADASHELRTPLTSIRGFAELYRQGAVSGEEDLARLMGRIEDESTRMAGLVEDLLLLARLDERRPLRQDIVDLVVLAADAAHDARATSTGHTVVLDVSGHDGGLLVLGDEERLRQVLMNLVTNALRHTPAGTTVTIRALRAVDWAVVEVSDDGPGLPPTATDTVFEGFARADPARGRGTGGGAGLGLTIVAALVRGHGGQIEVESRPGSGATFRVRLPLAPG